MNRTTTRLNLSLHDRWRMHEAKIANMAWAGAFVTTLLLIHSLLSPQVAPAAAPVMVQQVRPVIMVQTATAAPPLPTATPWPTPEPIVIEVPGPAPAPEVIYIQSPPEVVYVPVEAPPTMEPPVYQEPPPAPQQLVILDRQQWAEEAERQRNIQDRLRANEQHGGSGKMPAPEFQPLDSNAQWCAAAAAAGQVKCK